MKIIVGIDEVGRGCWAGPVVAGAVILPETFDLPGLRDSKKVPRAARERLSLQIKQQALAVGLGWVNNREVDDYGLSWAVKQSGLRALARLEMIFDHVMLDGKHNYLRDEPLSTEVIVGGDDLVPAISAAAILAKVARDRYMKYMDISFPEYGFARHVGYGTHEHSAALSSLGVTPIHRRTYKPVALVAA